MAAVRNLSPVQKSISDVYFAVFSLIKLSFIFSSVRCICLVNHFSKDDIEKTRLCPLKISYGGVLHVQSNKSVIEMHKVITKLLRCTTSKNDQPLVWSELLHNTRSKANLLSVIHNALYKIYERFPKSIPAKKLGTHEIEWRPYIVHFHQVFKLTYSDDGVHPLPAGFVFEHASPKDTINFNGDIHFVKLSWKDFAFTHSLVVLDSFDSDTLYIQQHTFYNKTDLDHCRKSAEGFCEVDGSRDGVGDGYSSSRGIPRTPMSSSRPKDTQHGAKHRYSPPSPEPRLNILSYNMWNTNNTRENVRGYLERLDYAADLILNSGADIVGMQEVRFEEKDEDWPIHIYSPSQATALADRLPGYQYIYQPAQLFPQSLSGNWIEEGLAIFSRYPIVHHDYILLPRDDDDPADFHQRICLRAQVAVPHFGLVNVFVTHLPLSHHGREASVVEIWKYMQRFTGPAILLGDLNAEPHSREARFLRGDATLQNTRTRGLKDIWLETHGQEEKGFTFNTLEHELTKRIDFIYARDGALNLKDAVLVDDGARVRSVASDHIGVMGIFTKR